MIAARIEPGVGLELLPLSAVLVTVNVAMSRRDSSRSNSSATRRRRDFPCRRRRDACPWIWIGNRWRENNIAASVLERPARPRADRPLPWHATPSEPSAIPAVDPKRIDRPAANARHWRPRPPREKIEQRDSDETWIGKSSRRIPVG